MENVFIAPSYSHFNRDGLFDLSNPVLNRDGQLLPLVRLRAALEQRGVNVHTADLMGSTALGGSDARYSSLGLIDHYEEVARSGVARLESFILMEPPVVAPAVYAELPKLSRAFDRVYVHNTTGDGYDLTNIIVDKLHKFYWPIPFNDVLPEHWHQRKRQRRIVVVNGSHNPRGRAGELYSARIHTMAALERWNAVDLYGIGWDRWWSSKALWWPYWSNIGTLRKIYKGPCESKFAVLAEYDFCLCFENMEMRGYMTEKMFDCFYAGTIPLYLGAPDITDHVPASCFVDCRDHADAESLWNKVSSMPSSEVQAMRNAGRAFLASPAGRRFYDSMQNIFLENRRGVP